MALQVHIKESKKGSFVISLIGRLDTTTAEECETKMQTVATGKARHVMLDMAKLEYISSMGLRVVLKMKKTLAERKMRLVVANMQPSIAKVFEMADILPKTEVFKDLTEADEFLDAIQRKEKLSHMEFPE